MDSFITLPKPSINKIVVISLLLWAMTIASAASAASYQLNPTLNTAPIQVAYYANYHRHTAVVHKPVVRHTTVHHSNVRHSAVHRSNVRHHSVRYHR